MADMSRMRDACYWRDLLLTQPFAPDGTVPHPTSTPTLSDASKAA